MHVDQKVIVKTQMTEFMQQSEPEIVNSIVPKREADNGSAILSNHCRTVEERTRQRRRHHERNTQKGEDIDEAVYCVRCPRSSSMVTAEVAERQGRRQRDKALMDASRR
jgi:hypothetical protein